MTNLNPAGATFSIGDVTTPAQQGGAAVVGGAYRAGLWSGTAASWIDLRPAGSTESEVFGIGGGQQAGYARLGGVKHAGLWFGTAASWIDLNPAGSTESNVWGVSGGQQAGYARVGNVYRAGVWSGTAASWVDLSPAGSTESAAEAISNGQQAGYAVLGGAKHAGVWFGTAASWVDLSPAGSTESVANGDSGGQQVGWATVGGMNRASLWSGTAASWVDLNPASSTIMSVAFAAHGAWQVGTVFVGDWFHASIWNSTAASWVDLSSFLPAEFTTSVAYGLSDDGVNLYVVGSGYNSVTQREVALLWVRPLPNTYTPCPPNMAPRASYACGLGPNFVAIGDVNHDGKPDLITASAGSHQGALLLGNGAGSFGAATLFGTGGGTPNGVVFGSLNGDPYLDFVVSNADGWVSTFFGNAGGGFDSGTHYGGVLPRAVATADFNNDGKLDLAVVSDGHLATVGIFMGNGDGTFPPVQEYGSGTNTASHAAVTVGDFNADGKPDLAVTNSNNTVSVLLGNGDGTFPAGVQYPVGNVPYGVAAADFDGDGKLDLAVANSIAGAPDATSNTISVLRGNGDGTFQPAVGYPSGGNGLNAVRAGDLNGDGKPDLVCACTVSNSLQVLMGNGDGTFQSALSLAAGASANCVAVGDLNSDGWLDIVSSNTGPDRVSVFQQLAAPATPVISQYPLSASFLSGAAAQFDVSATGTTAQTYRWRKNGVPLSDSATVTGAITPHLTLHPVTCADDHAQIDCVVSNACGGTSTGPATLFVTNPQAGWLTGGIGNPGLDAVPFALAVLPGGDVIAGGFFNTAGGLPADRIARYNPTTGIWSALGSGVNDWVGSLAVLPGGEVIVGGQFTTAGGVPANRIARYNSTTGVWSALATGVDSQVRALAVLPGGDVIVGGQFTTAGGVPANRIARYNPTTGVWSALGAGVDGPVYSLTVLQSGDVIAGGVFYTAGGVVANNIARYNPTTGVWSALGSGVTPPQHFGGTYLVGVYALAILPNGDVIAGGDFSVAGGLDIGYGIARCDPTTGVWSALDMGMDGFVSALIVVPDGNVIAGGQFSTAGGANIGLGIARWNPATDLWSSLGSGLNSSTFALAAAPGGDVIAGGWFNTAGGVAANSIARYSFGEPYPSIILQPLPQTACSFSTVTFTVASSSPGPFNYQWRKNAVAINTVANPSAATEVLALTNLSAADAASYDCIISDAGGCGTATSSAATLTVAPADLGRQGGLPGPDGLYDNNDFVVFIDLFFTQQPGADLGKQGGLLGSDGLFDNNDFVVFIDQFFAGC